MRIRIIIILIFIFMGPLVALAHPGNSSSDGGHYCWTNCAYYGVPYGVKHYHHTTSPSVGSIISYDELHAMLKGSAGYKKVNHGYKVYDYLTCEDKYTKVDNKCLKPKAKKLSASKESRSLSGEAKNERTRLINMFKKKRYSALEDLDDKKWEKYTPEILEHVPNQEILKYAPQWFVAKNKIN